MLTGPHREESSNPASCTTDLWSPPTNHGHYDAASARHTGAARASGFPGARQPGSRPSSPKQLLLKFMGCSSQFQLRCRTDSSPLTLSQEFCPTTPHPLGPSITWAALYAPKSLYKSRTAKTRLLADHLSDRLTRQEITRLAIHCSSISVYTLPPIGLVISLTTIMHYYVMLCHRHTTHILLRILLTYSTSSTINRPSFIM